MATYGQFPYMINIYWRDTFRCGGSIISEKTILTAGHCLYGYPAHECPIYAGSLQLRWGYKREMDYYKIHEDYHPYTSANDIAVVVIKEPLVFDFAVKKIDFNDLYVEGGVPAVIAGWGQTSHPGGFSHLLLYLNLTTTDLEVCKKELQGLPVTDNNICAYSGVAGKGACIGDSGSPLVVNGLLVGITSFAKEYCAKGAPDVYVRVSSYVPWILKYMV